MLHLDPHPPTLLICDENPNRATHLAAAALRGGFDPIVDPSRDPATLASVHRPDAVLLSATLPQDDARDSLAAIKADPATEDAEVVILVDTAEPRFEVECLALGALDVRARRLEHEFFLTLRSVLCRVSARSKAPWSAMASDVVRPSASRQRAATLELRLRPAPLRRA